MEYVIPIVVLGLLISYRITKRMGGDGKVGCMTFGYVSLVYLMLCALSIPFVIGSASGLYKIATFDTYEATVVDVSSYMRKNPDGRRIKMYTPTVKFTPRGSSEPREKKLEIGSGEPYQIGEKYKIVYDSDTGKLESREIAAILLLSGGLIFSLTLLSLVIYGAYYAFVEKRSFPLTSLATILIVYIIMPISMIGLNAGMIYYVYNRLAYGVRSEQPIIVLIIVIFFIIVLSLATVGLAKMFINKEKIKIDFN